MNKLLFIIASLFICQISFGEENYLEKPTGEYKVGFQDFRVVHGVLNSGIYSCQEKDLFYIKGKNESDFGQDNQTSFCRENMVRVYYPTYNEAAKPYENYYLPTINDLQNMIRTAKVPGITESDLKNLENIKTFSVKNATIVDKKFPVLIFDPGAGTSVQLYGNLISEIVSQGYIVVGINNTFVDGSLLFPDGRIVHTDNTASISTADNSVFSDILFVRKILNTNNNIFSNLINHMKLNKIGLFGHSIGGISVVHSVREQETKQLDLFQAAISLDAPPVGFGTRVYSENELEGFKNTPFLRFYAAEWRTLAGIITPNSAQFELLPRVRNNFYAMLSPSEENTTYTNHMSFSDYSTLQYQPTIKLFADTTPGEFGTANGRHIAREINDYTLQFFDQYLKNIPSGNFNACTPISDDTMLTCKNTQ